MEDTGSKINTSMSEAEINAARRGFGGKGSGKKSKRTKRRQERLKQMEKQNTAKRYSKLRQRIGSFDINARLKKIKQDRLLSKKEYDKKHPIWALQDKQERLQKRIEKLGTDMKHIEDINRGITSPYTSKHGERLVALENSNPQQQLTKYNTKLEKLKTQENQMIQDMTAGKIPTTEDAVDYIEAQKTRTGKLRQRLAAIREAPKIKDVEYYDDPPVDKAYYQRMYSSPRKWLEHASGGVSRKKQKGVTDAHSNPSGSSDRNINRLAIEDHLQWVDYPKNKDIREMTNKEKIDLSMTDNINYNVRGDELGGVEYYKRKLRRGQPIGEPSFTFGTPNTDPRFKRPNKTIDSQKRLVGHEGRHRARALMEEGVKKMPFKVVAHSGATAEEYLHGRKTLKGIKPERGAVKSDKDTRYPILGRYSKLRQRLGAIIDDVFDEKRGHAKELRHEQAGITGVTELESGKHIVSLGSGKSDIALHKEVGPNLEDVIAGGDELKDEATRALKLDEKPAKRKFMRQKLRKLNRKSNRKGILGLEKNFKYDPPKSVRRRR